MPQSIESYGSSPTMSGGGWGEGDPLGGDPIDRRAYRRFIRDLAPDEAAPEHPAAARGYGYVVEDVTFTAHRIVDGAHRDIDDEAREATGHLAGGDPLLAYLLARQWAAQEHGAPQIEYAEAIDAGSGEGFSPGELSEDGELYFFDADDENHDGDSQRLRFEVQVVDDLRRSAREWHERLVPPSVRRLWEILS